MLYPATLSADLQYLAKCYEWDAEDKAEVRAAFRDNPEMVRFFTVLAAAHRAGYEQCAENGYIRLQAWCQEKGLGNPFAANFDPSVLQMMAPQTYA